MCVFVEIDTSKFDKQDLVTLRNDIRLLSHISDLRHAQKDNTKARRELKDINRFGMKAVHVPIHDFFFHRDPPPYTHEHEFFSLIMGSIISVPCGRDKFANQCLFKGKTERVHF